MQVSIDESSTEYNYDEESIGMNCLEEIWDGKHVDTDINVRDARLKICDQICISQSEWKGD